MSEYLKDPITAPDRAPSYAMHPATEVLHLRAQVAELAAASRKVMAAIPDRYTGWPGFHEALDELSAALAKVGG